MVLRLEASASGWEAPSLEAPASPLLERLRRDIISDGKVLDGPYGPRRVIYCRLPAAARGRAAADPRRRRRNPGSRSSHSQAARDERQS
jgi:hypothetical protein